MISNSSGFPRLVEVREEEVDLRKERERSSDLQENLHIWGLG